MTGPAELAEGVVALAEARDGYLLGRDYHSGDRAEVFASRSIRKVLRESGDAYRVNFANKPVDVVVDRLEVLSVAVLGADDAEGDPTTDEAATARLYEAWDHAGLTLQLPNLFTQAGYFGDCYMTVWPEDEADEAGETEADTEAVAPDVNCTISTPLSTRILYDPLNPTRKRVGIRWWQVKRGGETLQRANLYWPETPDSDARIEKWVTAPGKKGEDVDDWEHHLGDDGDPDSWLVDNPYRDIPIFHFRTGLPYGVPLHKPAYGAQDAINKLTISHMSTVDFQAFPQRAALAEPDNVDDAFADDDDIGDSPFDDPASTTSPTRSAGETTPALQSGPGTVWWLRNVKSLVQLPAADSDNFTKPIEFYLTMMAEACEMTLDSFRPEGGNVSGESRRRADGGKVKRARRLQQLFGSELMAMFAFVARVQGVEDARVDVRWAPPEVVTDKEGWETVREKIRAGVPIRRAMMEAGYTSEQVQEWYPDDKASGVVNIEQLQQMADILQKLGAAVTLGVITNEQAQAMLPADMLERLSG